MSTIAKGWKGVEQRILDTKDQSEHPWLFRCPKNNCYFAVSGETEEIVRKAEAQHDCPYQGGLTHLAGSITVTLVEDMWEKADKALLRTEEEGLEPETLARRKGIVRGMCEMIAIFSPPFFKTGDEVGHELLKRNAAFAAGEEYTTPGIGSRRFERPPGSSPTRDATRLTKVTEGDRVKHVMSGDIGTVTKIEENGITISYDKGGFGTVETVGELMKPLELGNSTRAKTASIPSSLTMKDVAAIRAAKQANAFTDEQLAQVYKITPSQVRLVAGS